MSEYEQRRNENIRRNQEFLDNLFPPGREKLIPPVVKLNNKKKIKVVDSNPKELQRKSSRLLSHLETNDQHVVINNEFHCKSLSSSTRAATIIREKVYHIDAIKLRQYIDSKNKDHSLLITDMNLQHCTERFGTGVQDRIEALRKPCVEGGLLGGASPLKMLVLYYALMATSQKVLALSAKQILIQVGFNEDSLMIVS